MTADLKAGISYAHGPDDAKVVAFANWLRENGVDCTGDFYDDEPIPDLNGFMLDLMLKPFVFVIASEAYYKRFHLENDSGVGLGATHESKLLHQRIVELQGKNTTIIPIIFDDRERQWIIEPLKSSFYYRFPEQGEALLRRLFNQPANPRPQLGPRPQFSPKIAPRVENYKAPRPQSTIDYVLFEMENSQLSLQFSSLKREGQSATVLLRPRGNEEYSRVKSLTRAGRPFGFAYGEEAMFAAVRAMSERRSGSEIEIDLQLVITPVKQQFGDEVNINQYTADDIAKLRIRRILFNEKFGLVRSNGFSVDSLNEMTVENAIRGSSIDHTYRRVTESPLPSLGPLLREDSAEGLAHAKLSCVASLILSKSVDSIERLELALVDPHRLHIFFRGMRPSYYANVEPTTISMDGFCALS